MKQLLVRMSSFSAREASHPDPDRILSRLLFHSQLAANDLHIAESRAPFREQGADCFCVLCAELQGASTNLGADRAVGAVYWTAAAVAGDDQSGND